MIKYSTGDLFLVKPKQGQKLVLMQGVNCLGIGNAGIVVGFKQKFPDMFVEYQKMCKKGTGPGDVFPYRIDDSLEILNVFTQNDLTGSTKQYLQRGLEHAAFYLDIIRRDENLLVVAPLIGSGKGKLPIDTVKEIFEHAFDCTKHTILVIDKYVKNQEPVW